MPVTPSNPYDKSFENFLEDSSHEAFEKAKYLDTKVIYISGKQVKIADKSTKNLFMRIKAYFGIGQAALKNVLPAIFLKVKNSNTLDLPAALIDKSKARECLADKIENSLFHRGKSRKQLQPYIDLLRRDDTSRAASLSSNSFHSEALSNNNEFKHKKDDVDRTNLSRAIHDRRKRESVKKFIESDQFTLEVLRMNNSNGKDMLHAAIAEGYDDIVEILLSKFESYNFKKNEKDWTNYLRSALIRGHSEDFSESEKNGYLNIAKAIIQKQKNSPEVFRTADLDGFTQLHHASL